MGLGSRLPSTHPLTFSGGHSGSCGPWKEIHARKEEPGKKLTNLQRIALIQDTIEREIRPPLKADGGDIEVVDIDRNKVYIKFLGACLGCPAAGVTMKALVEAKLKEFVEEDIVVEEVK